MGLLAKAEAYLQFEAEQRLAAERKMAEEQKALAAAAQKRKAKIKTIVKQTVAQVKTAPKKLSRMATNFKTQVKTVIKKAYRPKLRRYAAILLAMNICVQTIEPRTMNNNVTMQQFANWSFTPKIEATVPSRPVQNDFGKFKDFFTKNAHHSIFTEQDRDDLARLLYGEAGIELLDNIEVLHIVLNRYASPLFKGTLRELLTAQNQFVGFKADHPVLPELRLIVDEVVDDFEAHGYQEICDHFYFVTHEQGICNKYEISPKGSHGRWVNADTKVYEAPHQGCSHAMHQTTTIGKKLSQIPTQRVRIPSNTRSI